MTAKDQESKQEVMKRISIDTTVKLLHLLKPCNFEVYTVNEDGILQLSANQQEKEQDSMKGERDSEEEEQDSEEEEQLDSREEQNSEEKLKILVMPNGIACTLTTPDQTKKGAVAKVQNSLEFTDDHKNDANDDQKLRLPKFLKKFMTDQIPSYVDSALKSLQMVENREYTVVYDEQGNNGKIIPVDFQNSGIMELNKKWGSGLQQMLEMKHSLSLSSMSVVTNFMSHVELFSRYRAIYGLSGTLGLDTQAADDSTFPPATNSDSSATKKVLLTLFNTHVCNIPTHKRRKLYEKHPIIVRGDNDQWFEKIMESIREAVKVEEWRPGKGRAVLVLCEDIKTATELKDHLLNKERWEEKKITLYAHSNSDEIRSIQHTFTSGEVVIATNLAGRGTDIKLDEEVEASGGLLCIVTFLPRNRRVELQGFGRTARKGQPGSVQCILKALSLPQHYQNLNLKSIRELRAEEEQIRLKELMNSDVKEVQLRETLFKKHCKFLQEVHKKIKERNDQETVLDSLNESWGQWLQVKREQIETFEKEDLTSELSKLHSEWEQSIPSKPDDSAPLPTNNSYHLIKFGNMLLSTQDQKNVEKAYLYYSSSIQMEPKYAAFAHYNCAYCIVSMKKKGYVDEAISHLESAMKCLDPYIVETMSVQQCVQLVNKIRERAPKPDEDGTTGFDTQVQVRMQIFNFIKKNMQEAIQQLENFDPEKEKILIEERGIFSLIPDDSDSTHKELYTLLNLGLEVTFKLEKKPKFCWDALLVCLLGVAEIIGGAALMICSVGTVANIGMALISEGISDCIDGIEGMIKGEFDWKEWGISKAVSLAVSLVSGGIARFVKHGVKAIKVGASVAKRVKELKAIPKVASNVSKWGIAAKENVKNVAKFVGKKVGEEAIMRGISYGQNKLFELAVAKIGDACKEDLKQDLRKAFLHGKLGENVDLMFIQQLPEENIEDGKMSQKL